MDGVLRKRVKPQKIVKLRKKFIISLTNISLIKIVAKLKLKRFHITNLSLE